MWGGGKDRSDGTLRAEQQKPARHADAETKGGGTKHKDREVTSKGNTYSRGAQKGWVEQVVTKITGRKGDHKKDHEDGHT